MNDRNPYFRKSKLSGSKFSQILRYFALDLTATDTAELIGISVRSINDIYLRLRRRLAENAPRYRHFPASLRPTNPTSARAGYAANAGAAHPAKPSYSVC